MGPGSACSPSGLSTAVFLWPPSVEPGETLSLAVASDRGGGLAGAGTAVASGHRGLSAAADLLTDAWFNEEARELA
jgi:hypothetical protein